MHIPPTVSENPSAVAGPSGSSALAATPAAGSPSFASFLSPHEAAGPQIRAAGAAPRGAPPVAAAPSHRAPAAMSALPSPDQPAVVPDKPVPGGGKAADEHPTGKAAKKSPEHTLSSALCLALLGAAAMMPVTPEPVATVPLGGPGETPAGNGSAEVPSAALQPGVTGAPLAGPAPLAGVAQPGSAPVETADAAAPGAATHYEPVGPSPVPANSGVRAGGTTQTADATPAAAGAAQRATADVLAKLGLAPSPTATVPSKVPPTANPLPGGERSASVAGLAADPAPAHAPLKTGKIPELLIRPTGPFTPRPEGTGTGTAQPPPMFHEAHALRSDAAATSVFHAASVPDVAADPAAGAAAPADLHAAAGRAVEAVSVAVEHAARDRNSVKLDFDIGGERVAVVVERHADEIRATFKADSPELRAALSQQWQATATERATSTVQPVFTDHASSHQLPDSQSRGFARQDNPSGHSGGEPSTGGDVPRRRNSSRAAGAVPATVSASPLHSRLPAFRHGSSLHLSTLA